MGRERGRDGGRRGERGREREREGGKEGGRKGREGEREIKTCTVQRKTFNGCKYLKSHNSLLNHKNFFCEKALNMISQWRLTINHKIIIFYKIIIFKI